MSVLTKDLQVVDNTLNELIVSLETIVSKRNDLKATPLVSYTDALALESIQSGLITRRMPLASYTDHASGTNYKVTMEALGDHLRNIRDRITKAFKELWAKLVNWFNATFRDSKKRTEEAKKNAKDAEEKTNAMEGVEDGIAVAVATELSEKAGKSISTAEIIETLHASSIEVLEVHTSNNAFAVLGGGGYNALLDDMGSVDSVMKSLADRTEALTKTINVGGDIDIELFKVSLQPLGKILEPGKTGSKTTLEVVKSLHDNIQKSRSPKFQPGELKTLKDKKIQQFLKSSGDLCTILDKLQAVIKAESGLSPITSAIDKLDDSLAKIENPENASKVSSVISDMRNVVAIINVIFQCVKTLQDDLFITSTALNKAANGRYKALFDAINELKDKDRWLKDLATMKRTTGLESVDFEIEDSMFEGNDEHYDDVSHPVDIDQANELHLSLTKTEQEITDLQTTQATLEGFGLESFSDTIKNVASKMKQMIVELIKKIKEWAKAVWSKITGKNSDVSKNAEKAKEAEIAEEVISKPAEEFTDVVVKAAEAAQKVPEAKRTELETAMLELAVFLVGSKEAMEGVEKIEKGHNALYAEILKKHYNPIAFSILFNPNKNSAMEVFKANVYKISLLLNSVSTDIVDAVTYLIRFVEGNDKSVENLATHLGYFTAVLKDTDFAFNVSGTSISSDTFRYSKDDFATVEKATAFFNDYTGLLDKLVPLTDTTVTSVTIDNMEDITTSAHHFIESLKSINVKIVDDSVKNLEFYNEAISSIVDYEPNETDRALGREKVRSLISAALNVTKKISAQYTKIAEITTTCDQYLKTLVRVENRRIRTLEAACNKAFKHATNYVLKLAKEQDLILPKEAFIDGELNPEYAQKLLARVDGKFDTSLIKDTILASEALMQALKSPDVIKVIM